MAALLETPSRVWRRIEAVEGRDMPSLPSLPGFEDSTDSEPSELSNEPGPANASSPMHSTPTVTLNQYTTSSAVRNSSSANSIARFASSIASRSNKSASQGPASSYRTSSTKALQDSFDISRIPTLPDISSASWKGQQNEVTDDESLSINGASDVFLPSRDEDADQDQDVSLTEALQPVSRPSSPSPTDVREPEATPKKYYDYSTSLKSEPKPSPFDKYRNVAFRKSKSIARTRTPSLSRTSSSRTSSPSHSTPQSSKSFSISDPQSPVTPGSVPLPPSTRVSPAAEPSPDNQFVDISEDGDGNLTRETNIRSMDITDIQISPPYIHSHSLSDGEEQARQDKKNPVSSVGNQTGSSDEELVSDRSPASDRNHPSSSEHLSQSPGHPVSALTSPTQSLAFTPTPMYPRPRARFNVPVSDDLLDTPRQTMGEEQQEDDTQQEDEGDLLTPHTRRRSFLLSIINSTARPRMKMPTPHPRNQNFATPSISEFTPRPGLSVGPRTNLQTAFAGVTPRPRSGMNRSARPSHPLSQALIPSPRTSDSESASAASGSGQGSDPRRRHSIDQWTSVPKNLSPYEASFISTASSHDLTTHHRANTSFDPAMGFGTGAGQGVGRFNAGKLNSYLHGLNRRLQEENELLIERLKKFEGDKRTHAIESSVIEGGRRLSSGRRISAGGTALGNVTEELGTEGWSEERAQFEDMIEVLREEKEELQRGLDSEKNGRAEDKEGWKQRMVKVEEGVGDIIKDLEGKIETAEKRTHDIEEENAQRIKELDRRLTEVDAERRSAVERAEKAERVMESEKELGGELRDANEQIGKLSSELRKTQGHVRELEEEVLRSDHKIDDLEKDLREDRDAIASLEEELRVKDGELTAKTTRNHQLEEDLQLLQDDLHATRARLTEMEERVVSSVDHMDALEDELTSANDNIHALTIENKQVHDRVEQLELDAQNAQDLARQMDHALDEAEKKMLADDDELHNLKGKIASAERERGRQLTASSIQYSLESKDSIVDAEEIRADLEALEAELDEANREIARLNTLLNLSPARKAMDKAKDTKMEMLEREKEELLERNRALRMAMNEISTPSKVMNTSGISPIHRQVLSFSLRAPRTPGAPLREMSWLNDTSNDPARPPLLAEISRLQQELDRANDSIDDKLDKLEDAGLGVVELTKKLGDARTKISTLEDEVARLTRREERRIRYLQRVKCQKCGVKVNLGSLTQLDESFSDFSKNGIPSEVSLDTRTAESLKLDVRSVNAQLEAMKKTWEQERQTLLGEKAVLQDATNRLNTQVKSIKEEMKRATENGRAGERTTASVQAELEKAKGMIADLEANLKSERAQLRALTTEQHRVQRDKADILNQLQRTESDMEDVKQKLQHYKEENRHLEGELRDNLSAEQKARLLEGRVAENAATIENLREERSLLAADYKQLQRRFSEVTEQADRLRTAHDASSTSHENRRHQLDLHLLEIEDLRHAVSSHANELKRVEQEKHRISAEKSDISRTVAVLEADLRRVKKDAETFGRDLKLLRAEKEKQEEKYKVEVSSLERTGKQAQTQIRLLKEQLDTQAEKTGRARDELRNHVCHADEEQVSAMKVQHNKECKGLIVQIRYLKAKFIRESSFRGDLVYQKKYLLILLAQFEKSEQTIFAAISQIGFPVSLPPQARKPRKLKSVAIAVVFLSRARHSSDDWREQGVGREAVTRALIEVRRHRVQSS